MTAPLFYVDSVGVGPLTLDGDRARHAAGSMRLKPGEPVTVCDGHGAVGYAQVVQVDGRSRLVLDVQKVEVHQAPSSLCVVQALPKGDHADLAVDLLTQTGASRIVPWASKRAVADWKGKQQTKVERWRRVAMASAMQSRRLFLPQIDALCEGVPAIEGHGLVLHEAAQQSLFDLDLPAGPITVVVGPEGGLDDDEVGALEDMGAIPVSLGDQILRTSSAGAAACVWIRGFESRSGS